VPDAGEKSPEEWRWTFEQYDQLRDLERPRVLPMLRALILRLRHDAGHSTVLCHRAGKRLVHLSPPRQVLIHECEELCVMSIREHVNQFVNHDAL
jgi:hypothetical protein